MERTLNTKATVDTVKKRLLALGVRYIQRTPDKQWQYWNDYSPVAIMDFYPVSSDQPATPSTSQRSEDMLAHSTHLTVVPHGRPADMTPPVFMPPASVPDSTVMTEPARMERLSLETMPVPPPGIVHLYPAHVALILVHIRQMRRKRTNPQMTRMR